MKLIIEVPETMLDWFKNGYPNEDDMDKLVEIVLDGTPLSDNATNGDVIKAIFGSDKVFDVIHNVHLRAKVGNWFNEGVVASFYKDWWNAKYKAESEDD